MADASSNSATYADSSFRETKKQFQIGNEPYLQLKIIKVEFNDDKPISIRYIIPNLGKVPAKFLTGILTIALCKDGNMDSMTIYGNNPRPDIMQFNTYVSNDGIERLFRAKINTPSEYYMSIKEGIGSAIFKGEIEYINLTTLKKRVYRFGALLNLSKNATEESTFNMIYSDNFDKK